MGEIPTQGEAVEGSISGGSSFMRIGFPGLCSGNFYHASLPNFNHFKTDTKQTIFDVEISMCR